MIYTVSWHDPSVIATLCVAFVAFLAILYVPFTKWRKRPILKVEISPSNNADFFHTGFGYKYGQAEIKKEVSAYYIRFRVINIGRSAATSVMSFLEKVELFDSGDNVDTYIPLPLLWANSDLMPFEYRMFFPRINPLVDTWCDLGFIADPEYWKDVKLEIAPEGSLFCLDTVVKPLSKGVCLLKPGVYRMTVKIAAENAKPSLAVFKVRVPTEWSAYRDIMFGPNGLSAEVIDWNWEHKAGLYRWWHSKRKQHFFSNKDL